jgi:hypothetical protein
LKLTENEVEDAGTINLAIGWSVLSKKSSEFNSEFRNESYWIMWI